MKRNKLIIGLVIAIIFTGCAGAQGKVFPYPFTQARIEIRHTGTTEGTTVLTLKDDKSSYETHVVTKKAEGEEEKTDVLILSENDTTYIIDLNQKQGSKISNPIYTGLQKINGKDEKIKLLNRLAIGLSPEEPMPEVTGTREFLGQTCELYEMKQGDDVWKICLWNGIVLYSEMSIVEPPIQNTTEVVSLDISSEVPDTLFQIPEGIQIGEAAPETQQQ